METGRLEIHCCATEKSTMSFPLGAICIKAAINAEPDLPKATVFEHFISQNPEKEAMAAAARKPGIVGISMYIWNASWFETFTKTLKKESPKTLIFAGGPQTTSFNGNLPEQFCFAILGEGEISTVMALRQVLAGANPSGPGILSPLSPVTSEYSPLPDLSRIKSVFLSGQADSTLEGNRNVLWEMTRGCPYECAFCFESRGKRIVRDFPIDRIEKELDYLVSHDAENVFVLDPTFNLNRQRAKQILEILIQKAPEDLHFTFEIRAELLDEQMAMMFAELNCSLQIGLQSTNGLALSNVNRQFFREDFVQKTGLLNKYGAAFGLDVIIGLPGDTLQTFRETMNFAVSMQPSNIDCFLLSVLPGTELASRQTEFGLVTNDDIEHTLRRSPTFSEKDIQSALAVKKGCDMFYTKGQSCMWIHCILETLNITACNLFSLFDKWMTQTRRSDDEDIWVLQDDFVTSLFEKTQNNKLIPAMKSFMELHQGLCYVTDFQEPVTLELSYDPDELALLDRMSLSEFTKTHKAHPCNPTLYIEDGQVCIK